MITTINSAIDYSASSASYALGTLYFAGSGKVYRYVKAAAACTNDLLAEGEPICADTGGIYYANNDLAGGTGIGTVPIGVGIGNIAEGYYGWIQCAGQSPSMTGDGSVAQGDFVVPDVNNDSQIDTMAAGEERQVMGYALTDDGPAVVIFINGLI